MSDVSPSIISRWVLECGDNEEYKPLRDVSNIILHVKLPLYSDEQISDICEINLSKTYDILDSKYNELVKDGITPEFFLFDDHGDIYIKFIGNKSIDLIKTIASLSPDEFEVYCSKLLSSIGFVGEVVGGTGDGCVDFIGSGLRLRNIHIFNNPASQPIVIGQAKKYKTENLITLKEIREFFGAAIIKADELKREKLEIFGLNHPTFFTYWTTSDFHPSTKAFAQKAGIWCVNGLAIAQLSSHYGVNKENITEFLSSET